MHHFSSLFAARWRRFSAALLAVALLAGCAYKVEVRQGSEQLLNYMDDLRLGMHRREVQALLGGAAVPRLLREDILLYTYQERAAGFEDTPQRRTVELHFDAEDLLREVRVLQDDYRRDYRADYRAGAE